jgi:hypothetical protein
MRYPFVSAWLPWRVIRRQISPRRAGAQNPQHRVDHLAVIPRRSSLAPSLRWELWPDHRPNIAVEFESSRHPMMEHARAEDIRARIDAGALRLLGRHPQPRAHGIGCLATGVARELRNAEVEHLENGTTASGKTRLRQEEISGFRSHDGSRSVRRRAPPARSASSDPALRRAADS